MTGKQFVTVTALGILLGLTGCRGWCEHRYGPCGCGSAAYAPAAQPACQPCQPCVPCCPTPVSRYPAVPAAPAPAATNWDAPRTCPCPN